jgi:hypothetical protein
MVVTIWSSVVELGLLLIVISVNLKRSFARLDILLTRNAIFVILFLAFLFAFFLVILADAALVRRVVQELAGERF